MTVNGVNDANDDASDVNDVSNVNGVNGVQKQTCLQFLSEVSHNRTVYQILHFLDSDSHQDYHNRNDLSEISEKT